MDLRTLAPRRLESEAQLDALYGGNRHQRLRQPAVELAVPRDVRSEPHGNAERDDLHDTPEGVAGRLRRIDPADDLGFRFLVEATDGALICNVVDVGRKGRSMLRAYICGHAPELGDM